MSGERSSSALDEWLFVENCGDMSRSGGMKEGAAIAFGLMGMAEAIHSYVEAKEWEAFELAEQVAEAERKERRERVLREEQEAWRFADE